MKMCRHVEDADCLLMGETLSTLQTAIAKTFGGISE